MPSFFKNNIGGFFECNEKEGKKAILHRFTAASAFGRYAALNEDKIGGEMSLDIAFPRNEKNWFEKLPKEIEFVSKKDLKKHWICKRRISTP